MDKTELTEDKVCIVLREILYSMADNENHNIYEPLRLKWISPINSTQGILSVLKNAIFLLDVTDRTQITDYKLTLEEAEDFAEKV